MTSDPLRRLLIVSMLAHAAALGLIALASASPKAARAQVSAASASTRLPAEIEAELPNGQWAGLARMRFFGFDIYDARLWVAPGFRAKQFAQSPFALELTYLRNLDGKAIAERSLKEMQRGARLSAEQEQRWLAAMTATFPDVKSGDRITGMHLPGMGARFWVNGKLSRTINDEDFSRAFFGIWLSDATSEPLLRASLLERATP